MGKEGWRGDSRVYGGLGMGSGAKAHPDQCFSKKSFLKIFRKKLTMGTKCAANTRGVVRIVALSHACVCGKVCPTDSQVGIPHPSRSLLLSRKKKCSEFYVEIVLGGETHVFARFHARRSEYPWQFRLRAIAASVIYIGFAAARHFCPERRRFARA